MRREFFLDTAVNMAIGLAVFGALWMLNPPGGCTRMDFFGRCTSGRVGMVAYMLITLVVVVAVRCAWIVWRERSARR
jgi:hypothetical protein